MAEIALAPPSPRDAEIQGVVLDLVEAFAFREAAAVLEARLKEIDACKRSRIEDLFVEWSGLDKDHRPDFLTYSHHRRNLALAAQGVSHG